MKIEEMENPGKTGNFFLILGVFAAALLLGVGFFLWSFISSMEERAIQKAFPKEATYYCEELQAHLSFGNEGYYLITPDADPYRFYILQNGNFLGDSQEPAGEACFRAEYYWNKKKNRLELTIESYPGTLPGEKTYIFDLISHQPMQTVSH